ncbi:unnamed protein product [Durusdinium trenchii]|uniref:Ferroxidase n=1 Tax=Durusdinium trenchii TaxID=1381693 RepID=A0ABP0T2P6_9DINO
MGSLPGDGPQDTDGCVGTLTSRSSTTPSPPRDTRCANLCCSERSSQRWWTRTNMGQNVERRQLGRSAAPSSVPWNNHRGVTLELRAWSATLVVLDAAEQRRCQQLLAAAAGRSERLGRSTSNCSTTASSASLHEIGCAPARCSAPEVGSGGFGRPSLQRDSREHHVKWTSFTKACGMTADERKHADLLLIHSKVWSTCRTRRAAGEASVMQMSPEERRRIDLKLLEHSA